MHILETHVAPNPRRVRIFLAEKGIDVADEEVDLPSLGSRTPRFTLLNPMQQVPVLILDDGTAISESVAICRYFDELQPEPALFGRGAEGKALVEMWNRRVEMGFFSAVAQVFRHLHPRMSHREVPQVAAWGEANKPRAFAQLRMLDEALARQRFIAGDDYSIADITALVAVDFLRVARLELPSGLDNLTRWYADVAARPSAEA
jgi:glutathione S-transferase